MDSFNHAELSEALQSASGIIAASAATHFDNLVAAGIGEDFAVLLVKDWHLVTATAMMG